MYIDNRNPEKNFLNKNRQKGDLPDHTKEIPFSKVPMPEIIKLDHAPDVRHP